MSALLYLIVDRLMSAHTVGLGDVELYGADVEALSYFRHISAYLVGVISTNFVRNKDVN